MAFSGQPFGEHFAECNGARSSKRAKIYPNAVNLFTRAAPAGDSIGATTLAHGAFSLHDITSRTSSCHTIDHDTGNLAAGAPRHREDMFEVEENLTELGPDYFGGNLNVARCCLCNRPLTSDADNDDELRCAICEQGMMRDPNLVGPGLHDDLSLRQGNGVGSGDEADFDAGVSNDGDVEASDNEADRDAESDDEEENSEASDGNDVDVPDFWTDIPQAKHYLTTDDPKETVRKLAIVDDLHVFTRFFIKTEVEGMYDPLTEYDPIDAVPDKVKQVAKYHKSQRGELRRTQKLLSTAHRRQKASARCTVVIGKIQELHHRGVPKSREKNGSEKARYGIDEKLSATDRLNAVKEVMACLFIARDIILADDRCLDELVLNPDGYLAKKLGNFERDKEKGGRIKRGTAEQ
nr:hypothetical protein B0A51_12926 [Rachicladosporium sp. CCFEE 5018]